MDISISLPLDADGFLRRECPNCEQEFKWHHGKTEDAPEDFVYADVYWCPRCGQSAGHESWWTPTQLEYQQGVVSSAAHDYIGNALKDAFRPRSGSFVEVELDQGKRPIEPDPLVEPDDMVMITPPCHPWEPVKVPEGTRAPFFCLVCGAAYAV
jgi:ribosomal protein S27AE